MPGGRPTKYDPKFNKQAQKLCLLGATDKQLADFFDIDQATLTRWKAKYPEFCTSLKSGKILPDIKVAESLYKRALGFTHKAVKIFNDNGQALIVPYNEYYPPDVTAQIFWLKNRAKEFWRDRQSVGVEFENMTDEQLNEIFKKLIQQHHEQRK